MTRLEIPRIWVPRKGVWQPNAPDIGLPLCSRCREWEHRNAKFMAGGYPCCCDEESSSSSSLSKTSLSSTSRSSSSESSGNCCGDGQSIPNEVQVDLSGVLNGTCGNCGAVFDGSHVCAFTSQIDTRCNWVKNAFFTGCGNWTMTVRYPIGVSRVRVDALGMIWLSATGITDCNWSGLSISPAGSGPVCDNSSSTGSVTAI